MNNNKFSITVTVEGESDGPIDRLQGINLMIRSLEEEKAKMSGKNNVLPVPQKKRHFVVKHVLGSLGQVGFEVDRASFSKSKYAPIVDGFGRIAKGYGNDDYFLLTVSSTYDFSEVVNWLNWLSENYFPQEIESFKVEF